MLELVIRQQKDRLEKFEATLEKVEYTTDPSLMKSLRDILTTNMVDTSKDHAISSITDDNPFDEMIYNVTSSIIRIGAVLIGIFLIQIMVSFARYYYKLSEHLSMTASLISLSGGKISDLKVIAPLLLPSQIDFGKTPPSPFEKIVDGGFDAIRELSKKIPTR